MDWPGYNIPMSVLNGRNRPSGGLKRSACLCLALWLTAGGAPFSHVYAQESPVAPIETAAPVETAEPTAEPTEGPAEPGEPTPAPEGRGKRRYATREIKLYKKRSTSSQVLLTIPQGTKLSVSAIKEGWGKASFDGASGFVRTKYLTGKAPADAAEGEQPDDGTEPGKPDDGGESDVPGVDNSGMKKLDKSKKKARQWAGRIVLGEGGMPIPQLYQLDYTKAVCVYNGVKRSVSTSGCGATSLSMVIAYLTGDTEQSPYTLLREACQRGMYRGDGLGRRQLAKLAKRHGVAGRWRRMDEDGLLETLRAGTPIIANMGQGEFTERGHYVVLRGVTADGLILVNDPASPERSRQAYPSALFVEQSRAGEAFMLCTRADGGKAVKAKAGIWKRPTRSGMGITLG